MLFYALYVGSLKVMIMWEWVKTLALLEESKTAKKQSWLWG